MSETKPFPSSVTIESITECVVLFISLNDFEEWIRRDIIDYTAQEGIHHKKKLIIKKILPQLHEEVGMHIT